MIFRKTARVGLLEQHEGSAGKLTLSLLPGRKPNPDQRIQLIASNRGKHAPSVIRRADGETHTIAKLAVDLGDVNAVMAAHTAGYYHQPLIATTTVNVKRLLAKGQIWAEVDGRGVGLSPDIASEVTLTRAQRITIRDQFKELREIFRRIIDPNKHGEITTEMLQWCGLDAIPENTEPFEKAISVMCDTTWRWRLHE